MNSSLHQLCQVASKDTKNIIGLMSGTSMDGLDVALCRIAGQGGDTVVKLRAFTTISYPDKFKEHLAQVVSVESCSMQQLCLMNTQLGIFTAKAVLQALEEWKIKKSAIDCIASHGQTVYHAPETRHHHKDFANTTLQIGDADHIAHRTGILTLSDFRQKHTAAGGEGAPLVAPVDELLFQDPREHRLLLNIGGIGNFTYLPAVASGKEVIMTDTGPGNTLMDEAARRKMNKEYDENGTVAAEGTVDEGVLRGLKDHPFFKHEAPKTTGPELFNWSYVQKAVQDTGAGDLETKDLLATLSKFTADTIIDSVRQVHTDSSPLHIYLSGGGLYNHHLVNQLKTGLPESTLSSFEEIGFNPDAKEAVCFAVLANEALSGEGFGLSSAKQSKKINFGKISLPN